jgi:choline dehydrogenase-like flavoprotein
VKTIAARNRSEMDVSPRSFLADVEASGRNARRDRISAREQGNPEGSVLRRRFEATVSALCYAFIRSRYGARAGEPGPRWNRTVRFVLDQHARMPDYLRAPLIAATLLLDHTSYLTDLRAFHRLAPDRRLQVIAKIRSSRLLRPLKEVLRFYETLAVFGFGDELERAQSDASTARMAPAEQDESPSDANFEIRRNLGRALPDQAQVVVIGSGPGGAITACLLAEAGRDVLLVESGSYFAPEAEARFDAQEMQRKYRNGGVTAAFGATKIAYAEGHCVGGGSEINAGLYHRAPEETLDLWRQTYGLNAAGMDDMTEHFAACEHDVGVSLMPNGAPLSSLKLHEGASRQGWQSLEVPRIFRYTPGGAPLKQSMSRTYIPRAIAAGCKLVTNARARRIKRAGGRWLVAIEHRVPGGKPAQHELSCETLFVCAGAIHTPALLLASGIDHNIGRSLQMHPTVKVAARFPETVNARGLGVPVHQVKEFSPRIGFGCSISKPPHLSLAMLDHPNHASDVDDTWQNMAVYYAMIKGGRGRVRTLPMFRDPVVSYKLDVQDRRDLADGLKKLCEMLFAAGAEVLYPSIASLPPLRTLDDLRRLPDVLPDDSSLMTVHLFSSCPMGEDTSLCATDSFGQVHGHDNLHIADASLLCTSLGVNPQGSVMAFARRNALHFLSH